MTAPIPNTVPTDAGIEHLDPEDVFNLVRNKLCLLVDVRGEDRRAGLIDGAVHEPAIADESFLQRASRLAKQWSEEPLVVFTCQYSAHRAPQCANWYRPHADARQRVAILEGGFRGWEARGLPVMRSTGELESKKADAYALEVGIRFAEAAGNEITPGFDVEALHAAAASCNGCAPPKAWGSPPSSPSPSHPLPQPCLPEATLQPSQQPQRQQQK